MTAFRFWTLLLCKKSQAHLGYLTHFGSDAKPHYPVCPSNQLQLGKYGTWIVALRSGSGGFGRSVLEPLLAIGGGGFRGAGEPAACQGQGCQAPGLKGWERVGNWSKSSINYCYLIILNWVSLVNYCLLRLVWVLDIPWCSNTSAGRWQVCRRQGPEGSMELRGKDRKVDRCHALGGRRKGASAVLLLSFISMSVYICLL